MNTSGRMERYLDSLDEERRRALEVAGRCRRVGEDPSTDVEIPSAEDLADRVESLMGLDGLAGAVRRYTEEGLERGEVAFRVSEDIARMELGELKDLDAVEMAVRTAVAILTEGVVAAPIEGMDRVDVVDGGGVQLFFSGPIRSAGGTAQAAAVLVADYVRQLLGMDPYMATEREVERAKEEIPLYKRAVNLQYEPSVGEIEIIVNKCPVMVTGEPTEEVEVSGQRNLPRIPTNRLRGGFALVVAEGIALKAPKLKKFVEKLEIAGWEWLDDLLKKRSSEGPHEGEKGEEKFLKNLIAGRPVFSHPSRPGGFRVRYGRSRNTGLATSGLSPVTMRAVDDFLATGTQMKTQLPGKAAGVAPVDGLEGPTVRLGDGTVLRIDSEEDYGPFEGRIERILDLGEILIGYGEFLENNHHLAPGGYTEERWRLEAEGEPPRSGGGAVARARDGEPLHPTYTYLWHDVSAEDVLALRDGLRDGLTLEHKPVLETLLVPHALDGEEIVLDEEHETVLEACLPPDAVPVENAEDGLELVRRLSGLDVRPRAPTRVGARMGRPEKAREREMSPPVHCLFPLGEAGGSTRNVAKAVESTSRDSEKGFRKERVGTRGLVEVDVPVQTCDCGCETYRTRCPGCGDRLERNEPERSRLNLAEEYAEALDRLGERPLDLVKGVKGLTSEGKVPEPLEKGILRAIHGVSVFKDGTIRYDLTDMPLTHFRPSEIGTSIERLRRMGYGSADDGEPLTDPDQVVELYPQDVVVSRGCGEHLVRAANFVDDLLDRVYGEEPFYSAEEPGDLVGELLIGLAPHTSAGVLCRLIGFTDASAGYGHPLFHAAKRRNCFHPDEKIWIRDGDAGWTHRRIQDVVEERLDDPETDDFGTLLQHLNTGEQVPSVSEGGEPVIRKVEAVSKHKAPDLLFRIETKSGRILKVTPDHTVLRSGRSGNGLERVPASDLVEGDLVPAPKKLSLEGHRTRLDLLEEFVALDAIPNDELMVRGIGSGHLKKLLRNLADSHTYLEPVAEALGVSRKTVHSWVSRDSIPVSVLLALGGESVLDRVPERALLSVKRDTVTVERRVEVDEELATLLGYYAAEGFTRREEGDLYQTTICTPDAPVRAELVRTFAERLGVDAYEENEWKVTVSSRLIELLFIEVLEAGSSAREKRIPDAVMAASESVLEAFLSAYFSGDGSTAKDRVEVRAHTVSDELKEDLLAALKRLGVTAKACRETRKPLTGAVAEHHRERNGEMPEYSSWCLRITSENAVTFAEQIGFHLPRKAKTLATTTGTIETRSQRLVSDGGQIWLDEVVSVEVVESDVDHVYCLTVEDTHSLVTNDLYVGQCDGDEDCFMLLLDGYVNFSRSYLPEARGGRMDAPLVLTTRLDPNEVDDEAHNLDVSSGYPLEFYEAADRSADPREVADLVETLDDRLGTPRQLEGMSYSLETSSVDSGPAASSYKTLGTMEEKARRQLALGGTLRAVDEADVATRVVQSHFLPDLIGNLRAFTSQTVRCVSCNSKYRRVPLKGECTRCGSGLTLTVHEGSVKKYLDISKELSESYDISSYTVQRIALLEHEISSVFENDKFQQKGLADFM